MVSKQSKIKIQNASILNMVNLSHNLTGDKRTNDRSHSIHFVCQLACLKSKRRLQIMHFCWKDTHWRVLLRHGQTIETSRTSLDDILQKNWKEQAYCNAKKCCQQKETEWQEQKESFAKHNTAFAQRKKNRNNNSTNINNAIVNSTVLIANLCITSCSLGMEDLVFVCIADHFFGGGFESDNYHKGNDCFCNDYFK